MTIETYGIPNPERVSAELPNFINANHELLQGIFADAITPVLNAAADNETTLNAIGQSLKRSLAHRISANTKQLRPMSDLLLQDLGARQENISTTIATQFPQAGQRLAAQEAGFRKPPPPGIEPVAQQPIGYITPVSPPPVTPPLCAPGQHIPETSIPYGHNCCNACAPGYYTVWLHSQQDGTIYPGVMYNDGRQPMVDIGGVWACCGGPYTTYELASLHVQGDCCGAGQTIPPITPPPVTPPPVTPPPPPIETTPPPGSSCDNPIYMQLCQPAPTQTPPCDPGFHIDPDTKQCVPDEQQPPEQQPPVDTPPPAQLPIVPIVGTLCQRILEARNTLIGIGQQIVSIRRDGHAPYIAVNWIKSIISAGALNFTVVPDAVYKSLAEFLDQNGIAQVAIDYTDVAIRTFVCDTQPVRYLYAVRQFLTALHDSTVKGGMANKANTSSHIRGAPEIFHLGGGVEITLDSDNTIAWELSIPAIIVPCIKLADYCLNHECPTDIISPVDAIEAYLSGAVDNKTMECYVRLGNANPEAFSILVDARRERLQTIEIIEFARRNNATELQQIELLQKFGWTRPEEAAARVALYDELPTISDHLHWMQRNVFDDQYVQDYGLMEGFTDRFWVKFGPDLRAKGYTEYRARLDYAAHWIGLAPTQMQDLVWRLAPDMPGVQHPFTVSDYSRLLAEQDYAPRAREWLAETVYRVPALGYVRDMYRSYVIDEEQLKLYHRKLGYNPDDAENFVAVDKLIKSRMRASEAHGWTPAAIASAYISRIMPETEVVQRMELLGYSGGEAQDLMRRAEAELQRSVLMRARSRVIFSALGTVKASIDSGVSSDADAVSALEGLGWPSDFAHGWTQLQRAGTQVRLVRQATSRVRSAFLSGEITDQFASLSLSQLGLQQNYISQLISIWHVELTPNRRRRSAAQIVSDVSNAAISTSEALIRLHNLGYEDADSRLFLADAERKILAREAQIEKQRQKDRRAQSNELARIARDAERQRRDAIARLKRESPPVKMQKWAALGLIGRDKFFERFRLYGALDPDIERWWEEACAKKNATCLETAPEPPPAPGGNGESGFP